MLNPDIRGALSSETKGSAALHETAVGVLAAQVVATVHMPQPLYVARAKGSRVWDVAGALGCAGLGLLGRCNAVTMSRIAGLDA